MKNISFYSLPGCGCCAVLKKKLDEAHLTYTVCEDISAMEEKGISGVPALDVDGLLYDFRSALSLIQALGVTE